MTIRRRRHEVKWVAPATYTKSSRSTRIGSRGQKRYAHPVTGSSQWPDAAVTYVETTREMATFAEACASPQTEGVRFRYRHSVVRRPHCSIHWTVPAGLR